MMLVVRKGSLSVALGLVPLSPYMVGEMPVTSVTVPLFVRDPVPVALVLPNESMTPR